MTGPASASALPSPAEQHFCRRLRPPVLQLLRLLASTWSRRLWNSSRSALGLPCQKVCCFKLVMSQDFSSVWSTISHLSQSSKVDNLCQPLQHGGAGLLDQWCAHARRPRQGVQIQVWHLVPDVLGDGLVEAEGVEAGPLLHQHLHQLRAAVLHRQVQWGQPPACKCPPRYRKGRENMYTFL